MSATVQYVVDSAPLKEIVATMKVSILISSYNGKKDIAALLDSIEKLTLNSHELEVILRDDNSSDGTAQEVSRKYPRVKLIRGTRNIGFSRSCNVALEHATGEVICCVNQDTILDRNFLLEGLAVLESHPEAVGVNTNMIMPWVMSLEYFLKASPEDLPAYEYQLTPYGFTQYVQVEQAVRETNFLTGGAFFLRRLALREGEELFDANLNMYCEDTDLSFRLTKRGKILMYAPKAVLYHNQVEKKASSFKELKKLFKITWNRLYVMAKHLSPWNFLKHYPLYVWGIVRKMDYLGLPPLTKLLAYFIGVCLAVPFLLLLPYWLWRSVVCYRKT